MSNVKGTGKKYGEDAARKLREAASLIDAAMAWPNTPQGDEYWTDVYTNLRKNASEALKEEIDEWRGCSRAIREGAEK